MLRWPFFPARPAFVCLQMIEPAMYATQRKIDHHPRSNRITHLALKGKYKYTVNGGRLNVVNVQTKSTLRFLESLRPSYSSDLKSKFQFLKLQMCDGFRKRIQYRFPDSKSCWESLMTATPRLGMHRYTCMFTDHVRVPCAAGTFVL